MNAELIGSHVAAPFQQSLLPEQATGLVLDGSANRFTRLIVFIVVAWPKEAFESISSPSRNHVHVQMGHRLTHSIVDGDERALGLNGGLDSPGKQLGGRKEGPQLFPG